LEHALRKHHFNRKHATPAPIDATTVRTVIGHVMAAYEKGNTNNRTKLATTMTVKGGEYIPYAERKKRKGKLRHGNALSTTSPSTASTTATSPMNRSLLQRQVAKQQRAMSQRQMSHARLHARAESSIEKQTFERNIQQSIRDRKWEKE
jgi:topoisomerase IA-like protein